MTMAIIIYLKYESKLINGYRDMTPDGRTDRNMNNASTISLHLWCGITNGFFFSPVFMLGLSEAVNSYNVRNDFMHF